ncbi:MAG: DUF4962 domain-containing protein [Candidatus Latescibacteria bacterium]|jgi:hypothetical protein|nr:DUF4962 domain-containing protein [Candidatus Latescibacterota bacterium]
MAELKVDETPARPGEWGFQPAEGSTQTETPPAFVWRPQENAASYDVQCARDADFSQVEYEATGVTYSVHRPARTFSAGGWFWRFRYHDGDGGTSAWGQPIAFTIAEGAKALPLPEREELIGRIPRSHPRLFVRPENLDALRERAQGDLKPIYDSLVATSDEIVADPPPTEDPPVYPEGCERLSEEWRVIWWGNRMYTIAALNSAATLGFTRLLGGQEEYGRLAREILMACAEWDPKGATGYRYNDEAGMPYNYYFSRTYTFIHDLLSEADRAKCRQVFKARGDEMYDHLLVLKEYLWKPYDSHAGRAWHFLGEVGTAFLDEIPEAEEWVWYALNVYGNVYPAWCDDDGGWHQGLSYWYGYIERFLWWADVMREAMGIDAFEKPYFAKAGDFPMYFQPPGTPSGGLADLTTRRRSAQNCRLVSVLAAQAGNPYWRWYAGADHGPRGERRRWEDSEKSPLLQAVGSGRSLYIDFVRGTLPAVTAKEPTDLPTSKCFHGVGQAALNTDLTSAANNVGVIFKSSPYGSQSHGFDAQNSFSLLAFGDRLLIHTGERDVHGSDHHRKWMHQTKSTNSVAANGVGQLDYSPAARGEIVDFHTSSTFDYVAGEAAEAYEGRLDRFTRRILFVKPEVVVIFDSLAAPEPATYQWFLHAPAEMSIDGTEVKVANGGAGCLVSFLHPAGLTLSQTDQFDPPPRERIQLVEYHLTAEMTTAAAKQAFVTVLRPHRIGETPDGEAQIEEIEGGYAATVPMAEGELRVLLQDDAGEEISGGGIKTDGEVAAVKIDEDEEAGEMFVVGGKKVEAG